MRVRPRTPDKSNINWNVHKARSVYVPRGAVLVNPPRPQRMKELFAAGGPRKALAWLVAGMAAQSPALMSGKPTRGAFIQNLLQQGMNPDFAEKMAALAAEDGQLAPEDGTDDIDLLTPIRREEAEHEAVDIAMALAEGHMPTSGLIEAPALEATLSARYEEDYPAALAHAGLAGINLVERFPVLNVMYGYTRGGGEAAESRLIPFRHPRGGIASTVTCPKPKPCIFGSTRSSVARWLSARGHTLPGWSPPTRIHAKPGSLSWKQLRYPHPAMSLPVPTAGQRTSDADPLLRAQAYPPNGSLRRYRPGCARRIPRTNEPGLLYLRWRTR